MVKKSNGKWCMYMGFIDLNTACLKDNPPLSKIDLLVDSAIGYELFKFHGCLQWIQSNLDG